MATVAQPCPSWTRGSIPFPKRIPRRRFTGRTSLTRVNAQLQARAAVVEATPPPPSSARDRSSQVLTLPANRAGELQAEGRAMTRAVNATVYNPQLLASEYGSQPLKVIGFFHPFLNTLLDNLSWVGLSFWISWCFEFLFFFG